MFPRSFFFVLPLKWEIIQVFWGGGSSNEKNMTLVYKFVVISLKLVHVTEKIPSSVFSPESLHSYFVA